MAALLFGAENPLGLSLEIGPAETAGGGQVTVPFTVSIPLSRLTLLPAAGGSLAGRLAISVVSRDSQGRTSEVHEVALPIQWSGTVAPGDAVSYTAKLSLRPLPHEIAIGVRDELGNTVSMVTASYDPAAPAAAGR